MSRVSRISKELDRGDRAALHLEVEVVGSGFFGGGFWGGVISDVPLSGGAAGEKQRWGCVKRRDRDLQCSC